MSKLPFVVEPRRPEVMVEIGSEESGKISIGRKGYLTTGEKAFVQQAIGSDETTLKIISISRKISTDQGISIDRAYADTVAILGGHGGNDSRLKEIETNYMEDFTELLTLLSTMQTKEEIISALCLLKYRIDADITIDEVLKLHPDIISGLAELYILEEKKSLMEFSEGKISEEGPQELSEEEIEKKPSRRRNQS